MLGHSIALTVYAAIWTDLQVACRCLECGRLHKLDLRCMALNGHGAESLVDIPFECECGSTDHEVMAESSPRR